MVSRAGKFLLVCVTATLLVLWPGCSSLPTILFKESRPGVTKFSDKVSIVNAKLIGKHFVIEAKWDRHGPWHFLVDTGSSVTLVSSEFARRYGEQLGKRTPDSMQVRSADGTRAVFPSTQVSEIRLGGVSFLNVPVLVSNHDEISSHLDEKIDGIIGYPFFNDTIFTLDYARAQLVLQDPSSAPAPTGSVLTINTDQRTPVASLAIGPDFFPVLIDTGSDAALVLNANEHPVRYAIEPRNGGSVGSLIGDSFHQVARLYDSLQIGDTLVPTPVATLTRQKSALGGDILKFFRVSFRPRQNVVSFERNELPLQAEPLRSSGLSFSKTPAYWRILSVIAGSPAQKAGIRPGDLVVRINGEPVSKWPLPRFDALVARAPEIAFTLLQGTREIPVVVQSFELVPLVTQAP